MDIKLIHQEFSYLSYFDSVRLFSMALDQRVAKGDGATRESLLAALPGALEKIHRAETTTH